MQKKKKDSWRTEDIYYSIMVCIIHNLQKCIFSIVKWYIPRLITIILTVLLQIAIQATVHSLEDSSNIEIHLHLREVELNEHTFCLGKHKNVRLKIMGGSYVIAQRIASAILKPEGLFSRMQAIKQIPLCETGSPIQLQTSTMFL